MAGTTLSMLRITLRKTVTGTLLFFLLGLQSCHTSPQNLLIAEWYFTDETFTSLSSPTEDMVLRLYPKGVYTRFGTFSYSVGKWRFNDKGNYIHLHQDTGTLQQKDVYYKIELLQARHLTVTQYSKMPFYTNEQTEICHLRRQKNDSESDPYNPATNVWRQPPTASETPAGIQKRVAAYLHFLQSMYHHAIDNDMETIDNRWYPTPIQMHYGNGVRMAYSTELDDWNRCFYDSAQAIKGYQFLSGQIYALHIKTDVNKFERNLDCVEQLLKGLK